MVKIIKGSPIFNHVRVKKFINFFDENKIEFKAWCWKRNATEVLDVREENIFSGGGYSSKRLILFYPIWILLVFIKVFFDNRNENDSYLVVDFDAAFPVYVASLLKSNIKYVYDVHDDFSLRYRFPFFVNNIIYILDSKIKNKASKVIHVDESRVREMDKNFVIIKNVPRDYYCNKYPDQVFLNKCKFAVTGWLCSGRGLESIYSFAARNPVASFIVAGGVIENDKVLSNFLSLKNVNYLGSVPQDKLYEYIKDCGFIFSLYDPASEINKLAASNKLYDSMMLGVPVITNFGLNVVDFVLQKKLGLVVDFEFGDSWDSILALPDCEFKILSKNCRLEYENNFSYDYCVTSNLLSLYENEIF